MAFACNLCLRLMGHPAPNLLFNSPGPSRARERPADGQGDPMEFCSVTCGHKFHRNCLNRWLRWTRGERLCPHCGSSYNVEDLITLNSANGEQQPESPGSSSTSMDYVDEPER